MKDVGLRHVAMGALHARFGTRVYMLIMVGTFLLSGCDKVDLAWSEEVMLDDGRMMLVERTAKGKQFNELGGPKGWDQSEMSLTVVRTPKGVRAPPPWRDAYVPVLLDYESSTHSWSLVATFYYCETWYQLGRPVPPYIQYRSTNGSAWTHVPLEERFVERRTNLLTGPSSDGEPELVTVADKERRERSAVQRFQRILRKWGREEDNFCDLS